MSEEPKVNGQLRRSDLSRIEFDDVSSNGKTGGRLIFYADEAQWSLTLEQIVVEEGPRPSALIASPQQAPQQIRRQSVFVPFYRVVHLPRDGRQPAVYLIPVERCRAVVTPCEIVAVRDVTGEEQHELVPIPVARARAAEASRRENGAAS